SCDDCKSGRSNLCRRRQIISMAPRQGAFAERLAIPERNLIDVPDELTSAQAALAEPLATGWHAVAIAERTCWKSLDACRVLVIGGGAIGMASTLALRARGCSDILIAETNPLRRNNAARAEIGRVFNPLESEVGGEGPIDLVIDCVGSGQTRSLASSAVCPGGAIIHVGLQDNEEGLDVRKITLQEIAVVGTYTYTMRDFDETLAAMASGALGPLDWFEERSLADGAAAFADLIEGRTGAAKIILCPEN
ncbi:MAG: zinc-binding dehydrogenase, partial [Kiloniellales bacterium]|nr:zinc-binding dehydrogenase [Kiloniellales bacterium]